MKDYLTRFILNKNIILMTFLAVILLLFIHFNVGLYLFFRSIYVVTILVLRLLLDIGLFLLPLTIIATYTVFFVSVYKKNLEKFNLPLAILIGLCIAGITAIHMENVINGAMIVTQVDYSAVKNVELIFLMNCALLVWIAKYKKIKYYNIYIWLIPVMLLLCLFRVF